MLAMRCLGPKDLLVRGERMAESKLFGGMCRFQKTYMIGVQLRDRDTRIHIKIEGGPRFGEYIIGLTVGNSPHGTLAQDKLTHGPAHAMIKNDGAPRDIVWLIGGDTSYVF